MLRFIFAILSIVVAISSCTNDMRRRPDGVCRCEHAPRPRPRIFFAEDPFPSAKETFLTCTIYTDETFPVCQRLEAAMQAKAKEGWTCSGPSAHFVFKRNDYPQDITHVPTAVFKVDDREVKRIVNPSAQVLVDTWLALFSEFCKR